MMNKQQKINSKFSLWAILTAVVIVIGVIVGVVFGARFDTVSADSASLTIKVDPYISVSDSRIEEVCSIAEKEIDNAGLKAVYDFKSNDGTEKELVYVFTNSISRDKLTDLETKVEEALNNAKNDSNSSLYGGFIHVTTTKEVVKSVLTDGYIWRGVLAIALALVFEFVYIAIRYRANMGIAASISTLAAVLLSMSLVVICVPITSSIIYIAAFAVMYSALLSMIIFNTVRTNLKNDEMNELEADEFVAKSVPTRMIMTFSIVGAVCLLLLGVIAGRNVTWFALAALLALVACTFIALVFLPSFYLILKKKSDKKDAEKARYDYKKGDTEVTAAKEK